MTWRAARMQGRRQRSWRSWRRRVAVAVALLAVAGASACGSAAAAPDSLLHKDSLVIGVKDDQPGLGLKRGGTYQGFDVDVARYVAGRLGFPADKVTFRTTPSSEREDAIRNGTVDLVVASYSVTPTREQLVAFGGPYYVAHQDILVRADDDAIHDVRDLAGKRLCAVQGSTSADRVVTEKSIPARRVAAPTYSACVTKLKDDQVDAVSTDDLILAGFAAADPADLKIVNAPFTDERYGVGMKRSDVDACEATNDAITRMYQDGTAAKLLKKWFGRTTLQVTTTVPQFEGCT